jgi:phosphotransferase system HPr (HPr) family protein
VSGWQSDRRRFKPGNVHHLKETGMFEKKAIIKSKYGIHARPSAAICLIAKKYPNTRIKLIDPDDGSAYDTLSILEILTINKMKGDVVIVQSYGINEHKATEEIVHLLETFEVEDH